MIDGGSFIAKTRELATGPAALAVGDGERRRRRCRCSGRSNIFVSQAVPGETDHYVFYSLATVAANGEPDLWMLDFAAADAQPVALAGAVDNPIGERASPSPTTARPSSYLDNFDPVTRRGDEYVVPLAMPARSLVATGVHNAAFIPGTTRLLYINAPDADHRRRRAHAAAVADGAAGQCRASARSTSPTRASLRRAPGSRRRTGAADDGVWYMPQP